MTTTKYKVMIDSRSFRDKNHAKDFVGSTKVQIMKHPREATFIEILRALKNKQNVILAELGLTEAKKESMQVKEQDVVTASQHAWISQQIFGIDIDNEYSVRNAETKKYETFRHTDDCYLDEQGILHICQLNGLEPALIYETLSSTEAHRKYRVLFILDTLITDFAYRTKISNVLLHMFEYKNYQLADPKCRDAARVFFGAKEVVYLNEDARTSANHLLSIVLPEKEKDETAVRPKISAKERKAFVQACAADSENEAVRLLAQQDWQSLSRIIAERFEEAFSPTASKGEEVSTKLQTMVLDSYRSNIYKYILDLLFIVWRPSGKPVVPSSRAIFFDSAKSYPLHHLFGLPLNENFSCILPGHADKNPSARIYLDERNHFKYVCYGCCAGKAYDIFNLFEIFTGLSRTTVTKRVAEVLNISESTVWQKEKREELIDFSDMFRYPEKIEEQFPVLYKDLRNRRMFTFMEDLIYDASRHVVDITFTGMEEAVYVADLINMSNRFRRKALVGGSKGTLHKKMHVAAILGFIEFLPDTVDIAAINIAKKRKLERNLLNEDEYKYRANVLKIPLFTTDLFTEAEQRMKVLTEQNFSFTHANKRETYLWALDIISADKHFVQDQENNERSHFMIKVFESFISAVNDLLDKQGYYTIDDLCNHRRLRHIKKMSKRKELLAIVTPELLKTSKIKTLVYKSNYKDLYQINQAKSKKLKAGRTKFFVRTEDSRVQD